MSTNVCCGLDHYNKYVHIDIVSAYVQLKEYVTTDDGLFANVFYHEVEYFVCNLL